MERSRIRQFSLNKILFHLKALLWEGVNHPYSSVARLHLRSTCKAYPIAILLHDHCAIYAPPATPLLYAIHHTILVMARSCKGQKTVQQKLEIGNTKPDWDRPFVRQEAWPLQDIVYFGAYVHESTILACSPPTCIAHPSAIPLRDY